MSLLDAFYLDHRRCGDLRAGVVDPAHDTVVWIECECSARITRTIAEAEGQTA